MDAESFLAACAPSYSRLCRFAYRYTRTRRSAERAVQGALVQLWAERSSGGAESPFGDGPLDDVLYGAVRREAIASLSNQATAARDVEAAFQYAMDDLPVKTRGVLRERLVDGRSLSAIAATLGGSKPGILS